MAQVPCTIARCWKVKSVTVSWLWLLLPAGDFLDFFLGHGTNMYCASQKLHLLLTLLCQKEWCLDCKYCRKTGKPGFGLLEIVGNPGVKGTRGVTCRAVPKVETFVFHRPRRGQRLSLLLSLDSPFSHLYLSEEMLTFEVVVSSFFVQVEKRHPEQFGGHFVQWTTWIRSIRNKSDKIKTENQAYEIVNPGGRWKGTELLSLGVEVTFFYPFLIIRWLVGFCLVGFGLFVGFFWWVLFVWWCWLFFFFPRIHYSHGLWGDIKRQGLETKTKKIFL